MDKRVKRVMVGFTLIEVLVALAILAIAFTALMSGSRDMTRNNGYIADKTIAHWVALNCLAMVRSGQIDLSSDTAERHGDEVAFNRKWHWIIKRNFTNDQHVSRLVVTVSLIPKVTLVEEIGFLLNKMDDTQ